MTNEQFFGIVKYLTVAIIVFVTVLSITSKTYKSNPQQFKIGENMDILSLLNQLVETIGKLQSQLGDAQLAVQENYNKGFSDGVASVVPPVSDKIYSQSDLDAALKPIQDQTVLLQAQIDESSAKMAELQAQVDSIPSKIEEAIKSVIEELKSIHESDTSAMAALILKYAPLPAPMPEPVQEVPVASEPVVEPVLG